MGGRPIRSYTPSIRKINPNEKETIANVVGAGGITYGVDAKVFDWSDVITADCPRKIAKNMYDARGTDEGGVTLRAPLDRLAITGWAAVPRGRGRPRL
jgi:hypothetical protein